MSVSSDNSKIIKSFLPPLSHLALVRIAQTFINEFGFETLEKSFKNIELGIIAKPKEGTEKNDKENRARENILFIPKHLRDGVFKAIAGVYWANQSWAQAHPCITFGDPTRVIEFFWHTNGMLDSTETAKALVLNDSFDIKERFHLACMYCLEESVLTLWKKMEESGETKNFQTSNKLMTNFWIRRINEKSQVDWLQDFKKYISVAPPLSRDERLLCSPFFSLLQPKDREKFLPHLEWTLCHEFQPCLFVATKDEEVKILKTLGASDFLCAYLKWPLQTFFLEIAEKTWPFFKINTFGSLAYSMQYLDERVKDFHYYRLFGDFWKRCPDSLRESSKKFLGQTKKINEVIDELRNRKKNYIRSKK